MPAESITSPRVVRDGKFFRLAGKKFFVKGVSYGPFVPNLRGEPFPETDQAGRDFKLIRDLGANLLRVYYVPPRWFLDLAGEHELKVMVDIPWSKHLCFLDSEDLRLEPFRAVRKAVSEARGHPAVFAFSVVNEIPAEIVRWSGPRKIERFIEELIAEVKEVDPGCLCTFTNYPPTEFLRPANADFLSFNVYLHDRKNFADYLARLQMLADSKPLLLAEFGMDSFRQGEAATCAFLQEQITTAFQQGAAGTIVFSFTDDWFRGGVQIEDWSFGLTRRDRTPKPSFAAVRETFCRVPHAPALPQPKVSVVVANYNGSRTLPICLESLTRLNYPDYEVIFVDDGSTDDSVGIASRFPSIQSIRHPENQGLSAARNTGIAAARGEIVAFTDSDCRADEDWLFYLVEDMQQGGFVGIGGHNLLPPEDSAVAAAVMASPGGPAHVMLTDRQAEHVPGCNMAFHRWALLAIGGFDPIFRKAGDDVDICWRLIENNCRIGFSPAGFVWHYRRSTAGAYLAQQRGYGEAEALLARKHPEYFTVAGRSIWRGRIYSSSKSGVILDRSVIYHGLFGGGLFQRLYAAQPSSGLMLFTSLEYHVLVTAPLLVASVAVPMIAPVAASSLALSLAVCVIAGVQADLPPRQARWWSRPMVALLFFLQPIARGLERYRASLLARSVTPPKQRIESVGRSPIGQDPALVLGYWSEATSDRYDLLRAIISQLTAEGWQFRPDTGWTDYDLEIMGNRWSRVRLTTVNEEMPAKRVGLRCRLVPRWSLLAKVCFGAVLAVELVVISLLAPFQAWIWMLIMTVPLLFWLLEHEQWVLLETVNLLVDEAAASIGLLKLDQPQNPPHQTKPPGTE